MKIITRILSLLLILPATVFAQQKPNVIFIFSDDHAFQAISAYGGKLAKTPNIDRIAREGAIFTNACVTNSICGPSRATLLTGKYSHKNGYKANEGKFDVSQLLFPGYCSKTITRRPGSANGTWAACPMVSTIGGYFRDRGPTSIPISSKKATTPPASRGIQPISSPINL
ncbi:sulfatase-like hydrolase/transferase [Chitinophaga sedimenti]|nr:sulfatase-like hydrolase/transferase [Chitinophaga sedimenti]